MKPILISLISQKDMPLDIFDLIATPQNLNCEHLFSCNLPLHKAVSCGRPAIALHLIKLGASVNQNDRGSRLLIEYFEGGNHHTIIRAAFVCLFVCLFVPLLLRGPLTDLRQTWWVYVGGPRNYP